MSYSILFHYTTQRETSEKIGLRHGEPWRCAMWNHCMLSMPKSGSCIAIARARSRSSYAKSTAHAQIQGSRKKPERPEWVIRPMIRRVCCQSSCLQQHWLMYVICYGYPLVHGIHLVHIPLQLPCEYQLWSIWDNVDNCSKLVHLLNTRNMSCLVSVDHPQERDVVLSLFRWRYM